MVDRCVMCGEIIPEGRQICPLCEQGKTPKLGKGVKFQRIRRITGYLVGTLDKCEVDCKENTFTIRILFSFHKTLTYENGILFWVVLLTPNCN